jgi:hypothetical protein
MRISKLWDIPLCSLLTFSGLNGVLSQRMELAVITGVWTSHPAYWKWVQVDDAFIVVCWRHWQSCVTQNIVTYRGDCRRGLDWWMDLLTTYTHDSELQATANLHKSQIAAAPDNPFQACYVFTSRFLVTVSTVDILQLHTLMSSLPRLPYRTHSLTFSLSA